jgi:hypothetical protein
MLVLLLVILAIDLVEPELDVGYFGGDGIDRGIRPAGEVAHRLGSVDGLGTGGLVDRQRIVAHGRGLRFRIGDAGLAGAASVA